MRDRIERILRIACIGLAALLVLQVVRTAVRSNPLAKVRIPEVPTLASAEVTNSAAAGAAQSNAMTVRKTGADSNQVAVAATNVPAIQVTHAAPAAVVAATSNGVVPSPELKPAATNLLLVNAAASPSTNAMIAAAASPTNLSAGKVPAIGTNANRGTGAAPSTVEIAMRKPAPAGTGGAMAGVGGRPGQGKAPPQLAPDVRARVDRVYESELFGQVMRPMPAALMGIAGNMAMLRSSTGQSGLVKEGDSLGELKLLQIGINRVLIEEKGEKKELMIFNGYGGESLLKKETPDETTSKSNP